MIKTGIFGGTFNPIHFGHIRLARLLLKEAGLDEVWFMVSPQNPFKVNHVLLDDTQRLEMVKAALRRERRLIASDFEFHLPKPSYTWNTLQALTAENPDRLFTLLIGGDNWEKFPQWYHHEDILANHSIAVYPRAGSTIDTASLPPQVQVVETPLIPISSTLVRQRVSEGKTIRHLVPKVVAEYIEQHHLYRSM